MPEAEEINSKTVSFGTGTLEPSVLHEEPPMSPEHEQMEPREFAPHGPTPPKTSDQFVSGTAILFPPHTRTARPVSVRAQLPEPGKGHRSGMNFFLKIQPCPLPLAPRKLD